MEKKIYQELEIDIDIFENVDIATAQVSGLDDGDDYLVDDF